MEEINTHSMYGMSEKYWFLVAEEFNGRLPNHCTSDADLNEKVCITGYYYLCLNKN